MFAHRVVLALLLGSVAAAAKGQKPPPPVLPVDGPINVTISGRPVCLKLSTGALDGVSLSSTTATAMALRPKGRAPAILVGGEPTSALQSYGVISMFGSTLRTTFSWFPDAPPMPDCDGTIGPAMLPFWTVQIHLPGRGGRQWVWPMDHSIRSASYARLPIGPQTISVLMSVERDLRYPLASAATGTVLLRMFGGRIEPETWDEDMIPGVRRPVRLLVLGKPLVIGPWQFDRVAINIQTGRDRLSSARGPRPAVPAPADPSEMTVKAKIPLGPSPSYTLIIPREYVRRCAGLVYDKRARKLHLDCAEVAARERSDYPMTGNEG